MELEYENIDWGDIVEAELNGDQETLRELRNKAAAIKRERQASQLKRQQQEEKPQQSPVSQVCGGGRGGGGGQAQRQQESLTTHLRPDLSEYPMLGKEKENIPTTLPFENFPPHQTTISSSSSTSYQEEGSLAASYAQMASRNAKRTLVDRCLSPCEIPVKRSITSDIMKTPTEFKTFSYGMSPSCDTTPETGSLPGKAGLVQRRLFDGHSEEQEATEKQPTKTESKPREKLTDVHRLGQRQKQIDFGKNTIGYERYIQLVPKWKRQKCHPVTPDKSISCSTRSWQGQMRVWRRQLHKYDNPAAAQVDSQFSVADAGLCNVALENDC